MRFTVTGHQGKSISHAHPGDPLPPGRLRLWWHRMSQHLKRWWYAYVPLSASIERRLEFDDADDVRRDFMDLVARLANAIQRAGGDHLGDTSSIHRDLIRIMLLVPENMRTMPIHDIDMRGERLS